MQLAVPPLPEDPLTAAARFHGEIVPQVLAALERGERVVTLVFAPAAFAHEDWRRAAVATLARECTPARINAVAGDVAEGVAATVAYIAAAPGLTGQYLMIDPAGAGRVDAKPG